MNDFTGNAADVTNEQVDDVTKGNVTPAEDEGDNTTGDNLPKDDLPEEKYLTQEDFDRVIRRKHAQWERRVARTLGVNRMEDALPFVQAGQVVSQHSGIAPSEVVQRVQSMATNQGNTPGGISPLEQRLDKIEGLLEDDRTAQLLKMQEAEAKKEFGDLYSKYQDDIEDKAEELGLSLVDAAAVVLRPRLKEHIELQARAKQQVQRRKKIEGSSDAAAADGEVASKLSDAQKRVAKRMNISYKDYFTQLKELGRI